MLDPRIAWLPGGQLNCEEQEQIHARLQAHAVAIRGPGARPSRSDLHRFFALAEEFGTAALLRPEVWAEGLRVHGEKYQPRRGSSPLRFLEGVLRTCLENQQVQQVKEAARVKAAQEVAAVQERRRRERTAEEERIAAEAPSLEDGCRQALSRVRPGWITEWAQLQPRLGERLAFIQMLGKYEPQTLSELLTKHRVEGGTDAQ